jgi:hypothetical protein
MRFTITISPTYNQMNLQEDIDRIKEVMGINEGFLNTFLRRRIPVFLDAVVDVADQIYVRADREYSDDDFRNFLDRSIFASIRDVVETYDLTHEELRELEIILLRTINRDKELFQTLKQIYISKLDLEIMNEGDSPISIRRRLPELINSVLQSASYYTPNKYGASFDAFLERAVYAGIVTELPDNYYDSDLEKLEYLEDMMKKLILSNETLLKKMKSIYEKRSKLKIEGINENTTYLKRRFPELIPAVIQAAEWYVPSFMPDFETYVDRAIYSGIVSVIPDSYADSHVDEMYELEDMVRNYIYNNEEAHEKFKSLYMGSGKKYKG